MVAVPPPSEMPTSPSRLHEPEVLYRSTGVRVISPRPPHLDFFISAESTGYALSIRDKEGTALSISGLTLDELEHRVKLASAALLVRFTLNRSSMLEKMAKVKRIR